MDNGLIKYRIKQRMTAEGVTSLQIPKAAIPAPFVNQAFVNLTGMSSMIGLTVIGCTTDIVTLATTTAIAFIGIAASLMGYNQERDRGDRTIFISDEDEEVWGLDLDESNIWEKVITILNVRSAIHGSKVRTSILNKWLNTIFPIVVEPEPALIAAKKEVENLYWGHDTDRRQKEAKFLLNQARIYEKAKNSQQL